MFVWLLVQQDKMQDKTCVHVYKLHKKKTSAGKLMWVVAAESVALVSCSRLLSGSVTIMQTFDWLYQNKVSIFQMSVELMQN